MKIHPLSSSRHHRLPYLLLLTIATLLCTNAHADYAEGQRLRDAGDALGAVVAWEQSAESGDAKSQFALGQLHEQGLGVPQNFLQAYKWYALAAARGEQAAITARDALVARMPAEQVAAAQALAAQWQPAAPATTAPANAPAPGPDALVSAAQKGDLATVKQLLGAGVSANTVDAAGVTPLMMAAFYGHAEVATALLAAGATSGAVSPQGNTALMAAAMNGHAKVVERLLAAGVDPAKKNSGGTTALDIARAKGQTAVVKLLEPLLGPSPTLVQKAQTLLNRAGYAVGSADGKAGARTIEAVRAFQSQQGRAADGVISPELVALLEQAPVAAAAPSAPAATAVSRTPGATFSDSLPGGGRGPEMVVIPAGNFRMGSPLIGKRASPSPLRLGATKSRWVISLNLSRPAAIVRMQRKILAGT